MSSPVRFSPAELRQIPAPLHSLLQVYPLAFDNLLEHQHLPPLKGKIRSIDIYFDDYLIPALSLFAGHVTAHPADQEPQVLTVFVNDECAYLQVLDWVLLNRVQETEFLKPLEL
jgi:hypothetical protein